jgi:hypothetical protein
VAEDFRFDYQLNAKCADDVKHLCPDAKPSEAIGCLVGEGRELAWLASNGRSVGCAWDG